MNIYVHTPFEESDKQYLLDQAPTMHFSWRRELPREERLLRFLKADICLGNVPPVWIAQSTRLRWLALESIGFDEYLPLDWNSLGTRLQMTHLKGFFAIPAAESVVASILALYRKIDYLTRLQDRHEWQGYNLRPQVETLYGKQVLILGPGAIGQRLSKLLAAFGCTQTLFGQRPENSDIYTLEALDRAIPGCDILVNILPGTPETEGILDRRRLGLLRREAILVNIGRGSAVDETSLIEYLKKGAIKGCVADVTIQEPLPDDHAIWDCPNLLLTQHSAGGSSDERHRKAVAFIENLRRYQNGKPLQHLADISKGY